MSRRVVISLVAGVGLVALALLGAAQLLARQRHLAAGVPTSFPEPVVDASFSPVCLNATLQQYDDEALAWALETMEEGGVTWVRQRFPWSEIEPQPGHFRWEAWDRIVAAAVEEGLQLLPVLASPPEWAGTPPDPEAFARFAGAFANHYSAQLVYYQIGHNPNLGRSWDGEADPFAYAELLAHVAPAVRASDPDARIVLGGLAPNVEAGPANYAEPLFLEMLYAAGAAPYFDIVAVQPYGFYTGPEDRRVELEVLNFSRPLLVREVMVAHGDEEKAVWASHYGWNSLPEGWAGLPAEGTSPSIWGSVDEATQAAYTVAALERATTEWPWMGVLCANSFQPRPVDAEEAIPDAEEHWGFAWVGPEGEPRPVFELVEAWAERPQRAGPGVYPAGTPLADFEGSWRIGPLGADIGESGDRVTLPFEGTGVALTVRRGPYRAFLFVTVDGEPAPALPRDEEGRAYVVLYDPLADVDTVPLAEGLPPGPHTVEVVAERGWYQWALVDWRVLHRPAWTITRVGVALFAVLGLVGGALVARGVRELWREGPLRVRALVGRVSEGARVTLTAVVVITFGVAAWLTWVQGPFRRLDEGTSVVALLLAAGLFYLSPWLILTLVSGALLALLVFAQPSLGLALTVAAAPFYLHPVSLFGKSFALSELVLLPTLVGWGAAVLGRGTAGAVDRARIVGWLRRFSPVMALVLVGGLSALLAEHEREALRELRLVILEPALFYVALVTLSMTERERRRIVDFWVLSAVVVAVVGLVQYFLLGDVITAEGGVARLRSVYGSPNNVGLYLGRVLPLLVAVVLWGRGRWRPLRPSRRSLYALALAPVALALVLTLSRGAILLGVPAAIFTLGLLAGGGWRKAALVALLLFALALVPLFRTPRFASLLNPARGTTFLRLALWRSGWSMFLDHPWVGVGPDNFLYAYRTRYVLPSAWEEFNLSHPHNWILDFLSRLGLLGFGAFAWLQYRFWRRVVTLARRVEGEQRALLLGAAGAMAAALAHGLVDASFFVVDLAYLFFLTLALADWVRERWDGTSLPTETIPQRE
jgi:O-antigen ligase